MKFALIELSSIYPLMQSIFPFIQPHYLTHQNQQSIKIIVYSLNTSNTLEKLSNPLLCPLDGADAKSSIQRYFELRLLL